MFQMIPWIYNKSRAKKIKVKHNKNMAIYEDKNKINIQKNKQETRQEKVSIYVKDKTGEKEKIINIITKT